MNRLESLIHQRSTCQGEFNKLQGEFNQFCQTMDELRGRSLPVSEKVAFLKNFRLGLLQRKISQLNTEIEILNGNKPRSLLPVVNVNEPVNEIVYDIVSPEPDALNNFGGIVPCEHPVVQEVNVEISHELPVVIVSEPVIDIDNEVTPPEPEIVNDIEGIVPYHPVVQEVSVEIPPEMIVEDPNPSLQEELNDAAHSPDSVEEEDPVDNDRYVQSIQKENSWKGYLKVAAIVTVAVAGVGALAWWYSRKSTSLAPTSNIVDLGSRNKTNVVDERPEQKTPPKTEEKTPEKVTPKQKVFVSEQKAPPKTEEKKPEKATPKQEVFVSELKATPKISETPPPATISALKPFNDAYTVIANWVNSLKGNHFKDRDHNSRVSDQASIDRVLDGQKVEFRNGDATYTLKLKGETLHVNYDNGKTFFHADSHQKIVVKR